jgi:hypothetical protein
MRDAGPPTAWVLAAFGVGAPVLGLALVASGPTRLLLEVAWLAILAAPSVLDRDGWRIRIAMAWLAAEQRRRLRATPRLPRTPAGADRWLERPAARDAGLTQASVLMMAGRIAEARRLVEGHAVDDPEDRARVARMLAAIDGLERGRLDATAADAAIDALPEDLRPYHRLSLAWSKAWVEAANERPWRREFARESAGFSPVGIPRRFLAFALLQQTLAPIVGLILVVVLRIVGWP